MALNKLKLRAPNYMIFLMTIVLFNVKSIHTGVISPVNLPEVPDVLHPDVPTEVRLDDDEVKELQESDHDPEVRPGLFQGDMAMDDKEYNYWRVGLNWDVFPEKLWKNATVPFHISGLYGPSDHVTIYMAIKTLDLMTCLKFVPWDGKAKDFLMIWPIKYPKGCWSFVGRIGGPQIVSLQPPDHKGPNCLGNEGRAIHELMHAIGIYHEQSRADRDKFVEIHHENVIPAYIKNFHKQSKENTTVSFEYDYDSIMHYGTNYFSIAKDKPTITPKMPGVVIGQRAQLSKTDCLKINDLYGCLKKPKLSKKYFALCQTLGL